MFVFSSIFVSAPVNKDIKKIDREYQYISSCYHNSNKNFIYTFIQNAWPKVKLLPYVRGGVGKHEILLKSISSEKKTKKNKKIK